MCERVHNNVRFFIDYTIRITILLLGIHSILSKNIINYIQSI